MADFSFKIEEHICTLQEQKDGWKKELNLVSWNGNGSKYDIRDWSSDHTKMSRGITLNPEEMHHLVAATVTRV